MKIPFVTYLPTSNNDNVICRLNIEYGFQNTSVRICVFEKLFLKCHHPDHFLLKPPKATQITSNDFKKRKCVLLYLEQFSVRKKSPKNLLFLQKMSVFHIPDDPEMKKKNWVSFNKNLRLHFVKKNPTFSNREIQCEKVTLVIVTPCTITIFFLSF